MRYNNCKCEGKAAPSGDRSCVTQFRSISITKLPRIKKKLGKF